jgi:hypothetical protein
VGPNCQIEHTFSCSISGADTSSVESCLVAVIMSVIDSRATAREQLRQVAMLADVVRDLCREALELLLRSMLNRSRTYMEYY